jgi:leucyl aminopeptidase
LWDASIFVDAYDNVQDARITSDMCDIVVAPRRSPDMHAALTIHVCDGEASLTRTLRDMGLDPSNAGARVITAGAMSSSSRRKSRAAPTRAVVLAIDSQARPHTSAQTVAEQAGQAIATLGGEKAMVCIDLSKIQSDAARLRTAAAILARTTAAGIDPQTRIAFVGMGMGMGMSKGMGMGKGKGMGKGSDDDDVAVTCHLLQGDFRARCHAARLMNLPGNAAGPTAFARALVVMVQSHIDDGAKEGMTHHVLGIKELEAKGLGLVLAVGAAAKATAPACMLVVHAGAVAGAPRKASQTSRTSSQRSKTVLLVGKGIMYDTGGLALKPPRYMYGMHGDKSGAVVACAVLARCAAEAQAHGVRLIVVAPLAENAIGASAVRPGDVVRAHDGRTVEIVDPDAEGRLVLADALSYGIRTFKPDLVVDFATMTMTGATYHPSLTAAVFAPRDDVAQLVAAAGERTGERVWRVPSWTEDADGILASRAADVRNAGWVSDSDGYSASLFLHSFVDGAFSSSARRGGTKNGPPSSEPAVPWVHIDVSGSRVGSASETSDGTPMHGAGVLLGCEVVRSFLKSFLRGGPPQKA